MIYLLDTNGCVRYLNGRSARVRNRMLSTPAWNIALCSVVKGELLAGARKSNNPNRALARLQVFFSAFVSLPFDDQAAEVYGQIRAQMEAAGTPPGPYDLQIAAIALSNQLVLVTHNTREFVRIPGLQIEDWEV